MRMKTSFTLSEDVIKAMDALLGESGNRSAFIEQALRDYIAAKTREQREAKDLEILSRRAPELNQEAQDVLTYQADL